MERPISAAVLAASSGALNVWAWVSAGQFATAQTGNSVLLAVYLATGDWIHFAFAAGAVVGFALGTFICGFGIRRMLAHGKRFTATVLFFEAAVLLAMGVLWVTGGIVANDLSAHICAAIISFLAGAQANAFHKEMGKGYSNVAPTNLVQSTSAYLSLALSTRGADRTTNLVWFRRYGLTYLGFLSGAGFSALIAWRIGWHFKVLSGNAMSASGWMLFLPAGLLVALALWARHWQSQDLDPDPSSVSP